VRFVPLGQAEGQRILAGPAPRIEAVARGGGGRRTPVEAIALGGAAFGADLARRWSTRRRR
jgi:urease accessory protein UreF